MIVNGIIGEPTVPVSMLLLNIKLGFVAPGSIWLASVVTAVFDKT